MFIEGGADFCYSSIGLRIQLCRQSFFMIINLNGKITNEKHACLPVTSPALLSGFAVFETLRTYNKQLFRPDDHLGRLYISADIINLKPKWKLKSVREELDKVITLSRYKESRVRVALTPADLVIYVESLKEKPAEYYKKGIKLVSYAGKRNCPRAKILGDAFCYLAHKYAEHVGAYEAILVDPSNYVRECAYANIFWVNGETLYTTNKEILFGITRETVIDLADHDCFFKGINYRSLLRADEVFITQTSSGILPVSEIDGHKIGSGCPGVYTKRLMKAFSQLVWRLTQS